MRVMEIDKNTLVYAKDGSDTDVQFRKSSVFWETINLFKTPLNFKDIQEIEWFDMEQLSFLRSQQYSSLLDRYSVEDWVFNGEKIPILVYRVSAKEKAAVLGWYKSDDNSVVFVCACYSEDPKRPALKKLFYRTGQQLLISWNNDLLELSIASFSSGTSPLFDALCNLFPSFKAMELHKNTRTGKIVTLDGEDKVGVREKIIYIEEKKISRHIENMVRKAKREFYAATSERNYDL